MSGVAKGAYFLATTGNFLSGILGSLASWLQAVMGSALDTILPKDWKMDDIVRKMYSMGSTSMFALSVTAEKLGFFLQAATGVPAFPAFSVSCQVQFAAGGKFGCSFNLQEPVMITLFKQGANVALAHAKTWFDETGKSIASVAEQQFKAAKKFVLGTCPPGQQSIARVCFPLCPKDKPVQIGLNCYPACPNDVQFDDLGMVCGKDMFQGSYGNGIGYGIDSSWCLKDNPQGCEQYGLFFYPKCKAGFYAIGPMLCSVNCPVGWTDLAGTSCAKPTILLAATGAVAA